MSDSLPPRIPLGRPLSALSFDLLRLSAGHPNTTAWCALVSDVSARYPGPAIDRGLRYLRQRGFITASGFPDRGWLTPKGKASLARNMA